jgi:hypothetical protein
MTDLLGLFKDTGIFGAIICALLIIILMLLRDGRSERSEWNKSQAENHTEWMKLQAENNSVLRNLSSVITEIKEMTRRKERD